MIVEPTPTSPRSPIRRVVRLAGVVAPVALLVAVVGAGLAGTRAGSSATGAASAAPAVEASAARSLAAPAASPAAPRPSLPAAASALDPRVPRRLSGLDVLTVRALNAIPAPVDAALGLAVAGHLSVRGTADAACTGDGDPLGPWCPRLAILSEVPWPDGAGAARSVPAHVHALLPAGVRLPAPVTSAGADPLVIAIGRLVPHDGDCPGGWHDCDAVLEVDRVAWAEGDPLDLAPLVADRLHGYPPMGDPLAAGELEPDLPLLAVLTWPRWLADIDPEVRGSLADLPPDRPVWYLRVLDAASEPGQARRVRWMLLGAADLHVIASGRPHARVPWATAP